MVLYFEQALAQRKIPGLEQVTRWQERLDLSAPDLREIRRVEILAHYATSAPIELFDFDTVQHRPSCLTVRGLCVVTVVNSFLPSNIKHASISEEIGPQAFPFSLLLHSPDDPRITFKNLTWPSA